MKNSACVKFDEYITNTSIFASTDEDILNGAFAHVCVPRVCAPVIYVFFRVRFALHALVCKKCAQKKRRFVMLHTVLRGGFLPPSPAREDSIMAVLLAEDAQAAKAHVNYGSLGGWAVSGVLIAVCLLSVYFNVDFLSIARSQGISFVLPLSITIGAVITIYGAFFIGSHLEALCSKLGLEFK